MNLAVIHRKSGNYDIALNYLDSCFINDWVIENKSIEMPFRDAERGYIMLKLGKYNAAKKHLYAAQNNAAPNISYTPNINLYIGEYQMEQNQPDSAIFYFNKSLLLIRNQKLRSDFESEVLNKLSDVYYSIGKIRRAYSYLIQSQEVADSILQLKNQTNSELFEIKNTYLQSISQKNELLEQQTLVIRQNNQIQTRLKIILALILLLGIVIFLIIRMRLKLRKTLTEKEANEFQSKVKEERSQAKLESKSKELTSYALQLIDKDSAIDDLLKVIQEESPSTYKAQYNRHKKGSTDLWNEFNLRFTEVNSAFYSRLKSKHPNLSITEQKHCALIKLHFATKEMARILNIETHSVHMSRSRIRKKIGLQRSDSLENYIAELQLNIVLE